MTTGVRIKLQFVLGPAIPEAVDRPTLEARLRGFGMSLTGLGAASASAEIDVDSYRRLWGEPPTTQGGFNQGLQGPELAVPDGLRSDIQSVAVVPRHVSFNKGRNP